jgi:hypothetical protein
MQVVDRCQCKQLQNDVEDDEIHQYKHIHLMAVVE